MSEVPTFYLREIEKTDLKILQVWRHDPELVHYLKAGFRYVAPPVDEAWLENYYKNRDTNVRLAICLSSLPEPIGLVYLTAIHPIHRSAEYSIMIGNKKFWGKGIGKRVTKEVLRHGFVDLGLHRIYSYVLEENRRSFSMFQSLGFTVEGKLRQAVYKESCFQNVVLLSFLRSDFQKGG